MTFDGAAWVDALEASSVRSKEAWLVAEALASFMDSLGSATPAEIVSEIERSGAWCSLFDELDGVPAGVIFANGCRELEAAHLLLDLGPRIVAVLPQITVEVNSNA